MDLYKCDTFNLVLSDLLLTQTDGTSGHWDTHPCLRTHRDQLLMQVAEVDEGRGLLIASLATNHLRRVIFRSTKEDDAGF